MRKLLLATATTAALTMSAMVGHAAADDDDLKSRFLDNFASAVVMAGGCNALKLNWKMVRIGMEFFKEQPQDVSPGGRDWPKIQVHMMETRKHSDGLPESAVCYLALAMFGPTGVVAKNFLVGKE